MTLLATAKAFAYMMTELRIPAMITAVLLEHHEQTSMC